MTMRGWRWPYRNFSAGAAVFGQMPNDKIDVASDSRGQIDAERTLPTLLSYIRA
jgi:hypothetical protein